MDATKNIEIRHFSFKQNFYIKKFINLLFLDKLNVNSDIY